MVSFAAGRGHHRIGGDRIARRHQGSQERKFFGTRIRHALSLPRPRVPHPITMVFAALRRLLVTRVGRSPGTA
jgi:hypothetical protein